MFGFQGEAVGQEFTVQYTARCKRPPPEVSLMNLASGGRVPLDSFRGKVVLPGVLGERCGPCREPLKKLNQLGARET